MKVIQGSITVPKGFLAQGVCAEIKKKEKKDVAVIFSRERCTTAAVYTTSKVRAACIDVSQENLKDGWAQAIVANSGVANACTGDRGVADARKMAEITANALGIAAQDVLVASTGTIGVFLPMDRMTAGIQKAAGSLCEEGATNAALAIMTTDLYRKEIAVEFDIQGYPVRLGAIAKGSGMIHPNMATMLAFITTDAAISSKCLQQALSNSTRLSYNMISVDRDTSTNDMAVVMANGLAGHPVIDDCESEDYRIFQEALDYVNIFLAKAIARDGEGANHLIEVQVVNAADLEAARTIARSIVSSNLVKAAVFGADANWGRILAAAGYSGADFDPARADVYLGKVKVAENGMGLVFDEAQALEELQKENVDIIVDLKAGDHHATAWGCDLSYDYVRINGSYRT